MTQQWYTMYNVCVYCYSLVHKNTHTIVFLLPVEVIYKLPVKSEIRGINDM
jgi:hypothetical protein